MRNALILFCFFGVSTLNGLQALAADAPSDNPYSVYAPSISSPQAVDQMLPVRGSDLPLPTVGGNGVISAGPHEPVVEAIPTPTGFQAGLMLLGSIIVVRAIRKLRLA